MQHATRISLSCVNGFHQDCIDGLCHCDHHYKIPDRIRESFWDSLWRIVVDWKNNTKTIARYGRG